jgi:germination protein M
MPEGVKLREVYTVNNNRTVYVDLTKEFLQIPDNAQAQTALNALVTTVTELNIEQNVQVLVEGEIVEEIAGVKIDVPLQRAAYINSLLPDENAQGVTVYFSDNEVLFLIPVTVALPSGSDENNLPRAAVEALLAGPPPDSGLVRTIWPDTKLLDFKLEYGLATVDLSKEAVGYGGGTTAEGALVNSLLHTLTRFNEVNQVQLLIDGQQREYLPEGTAIDEPLRRPEQINYQH